jgi:hypothetical protein
MYEITVMTINTYLIIGSIIGGIFAIALLVLMWLDKTYIEETKIKYSYLGKSLATILTGAVIINIVLWPIIVAFIVTKIILRSPTRPK